MFLKIRGGQPLEVGEKVVPNVVLEMTRGADQDPSHQEAEQPSGHPNQQEQCAILDELRPGHTLGQIVDRVLQNNR